MNNDAVNKKIDFLINSVKYDCAELTLIQPKQPQSGCVLFLPKEAWLTGIVMFYAHLKRH